MMWVVVGGILGAFVGEAIGREYWLWGLLIGIVLGQGQLLRLRKASQSDLETLRSEVRALRLHLETLPTAAVGDPAADAKPLANRADGATIEPATRDAALVIAPATASESVDAPLTGPRATDASASPPEDTTRDGIDARPTVAMDRITPDPSGTRSSPREDGASVGAADVFARAWAWLFGGNAIVRIGIVVLFCGVAFLLKYTYDRIEVPIELRLIAVFIGAIVLLVIGWRLRERRRDYALVMQGGAIGILFLTVFGAFRLWSLIDAGPAFAILILLAGLAAMLAILQDALVLAVIGTAGGFLAPILASSGKGSHVMLFSYYAVLNVGIVTMALFKAWRALNLLGFVFTFMIALLWANRYYQPEFFATTEPFLIFHFVLFLVVTLLFARQRAGRAAAYVDGTLVFGVPIVGFAMQWGLVRDTDYGLAFSAVALGAVYLILGTALFRQHGDRFRMLVEAFLALGIVFATLAIPLALTGKWTVAAWALEGAGLVWAGLRQSHLASRLFGLFVQVAAVFAFSLHADRITDGSYNAADTLSLALLACAFLFTSRQYTKLGANASAPEVIVEPTAFALGGVFWLAWGAHFLDAHLVRHETAHAFLVYAAASALAANIVGVRLAWLAPRVASQLFAVIVLVMLGVDLELRHPFLDWGWAAWPIAFAALIWIVHREETILPLVRPWRHALMAWLLVAVATLEGSWALAEAAGASGDWSLAAWGIIPALTIIATALWGERIGWPIAANRAAYLGIAAPPIVAFLIGWLLFASIVARGNTPPIPYVPVVNPVDVAQLFSLLAIGAWFLAVKRASVGFLSTLSGRHAAAIGGLLAFMLFNTFLLRTLHQFGGVPYDLQSMLRSPLVQATLAIAWTLIALGLMFAGTKKAERGVWIAGAAVLGVVVVKLLLLDLARHATVMRIVAFIAVGALMLVIGYLAPLPPRPTEVR
jgi:uncharacterized membrane protein